MIQIKNRYTAAVIHRCESAEDVRDAVLDAVAKGISLTGANLTGANLTGVDLTGANLTRANLTEANLTRANLTRANLTEADLTEAKLTGVDLTGADLTEAKLTRANLTEADLTEAKLTRANLTEAKLGEIPAYVPRVPMLHNRMLDAIKKGAKLDMSTWHLDGEVGKDGAYCETTHCRAGWAVTFAGAAGRVLEGCYGPAVAGALISIASCPELEGKVPDFYAGDSAALADIKRVAGLEHASAKSKPAAKESAAKKRTAARAAR